MTRDDCLALAAQCVTRDRNALYGPPERSFHRIAGLWAAYLGHPVTSLDVARLLILMKVARSTASPQHPDNWIDLAGYAACGAEIATGAAEPPAPPTLLDPDYHAPGGRR